MSLTIAERVARSRAAQGLPPVVTDPATIDRAASVLRLDTRKAG